MSPEQMDGVASLDHRTDLWALGVLAFHMLTGNAPFRGSHIAHIAHAIMHGERPKISTARPELPFALDAWLERALARNPQDRFSSARELADTLALAFGDLAYTTNRRQQLALPTGPNLPSSLGPQAVPPSSVPIPVHITMNMPTSTSMNSLDQVGATLGPTANTHSPYGSSGRLKWWVMGVAVLGFILVGLSYKVGYDHRTNAGELTFSGPPPSPPPAVVMSPPPLASSAAPPPVAMELPAKAPPTTTAASG
jgi:serine/threonine-protein kinase